MIKDSPWWFNIFCGLERTLLLSYQKKTRSAGLHPSSFVMTPTLYSLYSLVPAQSSYKVGVIPKDGCAKGTPFGTTMTLALRQGLVWWSSEISFGKIENIDIRFPCCQKTLCGWESRDKVNLGCPWGALDFIGLAILNSRWVKGTSYIPDALFQHLWKHTISEVICLWSP